ncbi:complement factor B-like [Genypterus blacodes]|uniref:complement factor B-like n=1 Tax=Genypterus blacodes TaxID=154954 RepID=UPI003F76F8F4
MGLSVGWRGFVAFSFLLYMGGGVWGNCTEYHMQMEGGTYSLTKEMEQGSTLVYHCPEGFYPYPALSRLCQLNNLWKPPPKRFRPQKCKMVECPDPTVIRNADITPTEAKYFVHNVTTYDCYSSYTLRGSSRRVCLPNGKWSGTTPICSRDTGNGCPDPGIPAGTSRAGDSFDIDDKVKYRCNANLYLVGSSERRCLENGQWTGTEPTCFYRHTYDTPLEVSEAFGSSIKESLNMLESMDDTQSGRKITLTKNGTLNMYIAVDISTSIEKHEFESAKQAVIKLIEKISSFSVNPNYDIIFFSAEIIQIVNIIDFFALQKEQNIYASIMKKLKDFNVGDRELVGTDLNQVFQTFYEHMAFVRQQAGHEFNNHQHVFILFTDGAYNMGGKPDATVARIKNMVYMNDTEGRQEHLDIYIFGIGTEIFDTDLQPLTVGTGGLHYFRLRKINDLQETFEEIIDEEDVKGLCGLYRDTEQYQTGEKRKVYPWLAYIIVKGNKCLGSLVTPQFVLTAAHCFKFDDLPEDIQVEIDDGQGLVKRAKALRLHPNYNVTAKVKDGVKEFYDYDVALIQLEKNAVKISSDARPICIPGTLETTAALKMVGVATCKQQEQLLLRNEREALTFLTKSHGQVREKNVYAKLGANRNDCIRHALSATGITTTNPKAAVTDNFLCTGGLDFHRDHIACTGDSGGAVFKNYERRTIQVGLVSWGTKVKCAMGEVVESDATSRDFHINLFRVMPFLKSVLADDDQDDFAPLQFLEGCD